MRTMCKYLKLAMLIALIGSGMVLNAQEAKLARAQALYNEKKPELAQLCIDSVIAHPETKARFEAWTMRSFIYFEIYKKTDRFKLNSKLRDTVISSALTSNKLKADADFASQNKKVLMAVASNYHKIASIYLLDSANYESSVKAYEKFKETSRLADPSIDLRGKDTEYYLAVGSEFSQKFNMNKTNTKAFEIAKVALLKVLEINPNDTSANMNMGLMYLNQATDLVESIDAGDTPFEKLDVIIDNSIKLAKQAEQFLLKVYDQNNKNRKAVLALYYVYRVLSDDAKKLQFENKCKELKIEVTDAAPKQQK